MASESGAGCGVLLAALLVVGFLANDCSVSLDSEPTCDDVAYYNDEAQDAGAEKFDEDSMDDYLDALDALEKAEQDCAEQGKEPRY